VIVFISFSHRQDLVGTEEAELFYKITAQSQYDDPGKKSTHPFAGYEKSG